MDIDILGIDLAKRVFQLRGADRRARIARLQGAARGVARRGTQIAASDHSHGSLQLGSSLGMAIPFNGNRSATY